MIEHVSRSLSTVAELKMFAVCSSLPFGSHETKNNISCSLNQWCATPTVWYTYANQAVSRCCVPFFPLPPCCFQSRIHHVGSKGLYYRTTPVQICSQCWSCSIARSASQATRRGHDNVPLGSKGKARATKFFLWGVEIDRTKASE